MQTKNNVNSAYGCIDLDMFETTIYYATGSLPKYKTVNDYP